VNFIDGLDGLAAGIVAIGAGAFFVYSHQLGVVGNIQASNAGPLIAVIAVGLCVGFLPHNFHPAKIFMGDAGSMLLGVLVAASTLAVVGQDSYQFSGRTYFFFAPIIIPFFILGIPLLDTVFAVVRRAGQRTSPAVADLSHLHHRLMRLGHGHRAAVLILWAWTALLSGLVLWPGVTDSHNAIPPIAVGALAILLYTLFAPRGRSALSNGDSDGNVGNATNGHGSGHASGRSAGRRSERGSQPLGAGLGSPVTAPTPRVGTGRPVAPGKPPSPAPARGAVATGGLGNGPSRPGAQNPRSSNGVRLVLPDRADSPAGTPTAGTPALGTPKTVAPGPPVPEGL
jgi:Glycosyl transferase family 4